MKRLGLLLSFLVASCSTAPIVYAYDIELAYCLDNAASERVDCTAEYLRLKAVCMSQRAFDRWIDDATSEIDYADCLNDAVEDKVFCRSLIDSCFEE